MSWMEQLAEIARRSAGETTFEEWIDKHGLRPYVTMCASGSLGMQAPAIHLLRDAYEREQIARLIPDWWWARIRGRSEPA